MRRFLNLEASPHKPSGNRFAEIRIVIHEQQVNFLGIESHQRNLWLGAMNLQNSKRRAMLGCIAHAFDPL